MDMDRDKMAERILHLTLEILFRLTGEDYTVVKKTSSEQCPDPVSEGWGRPLSPITGPPPHFPIHEDINDQKILELTYKMIELLTGEVPIRCQDVTVYFSMEEWEYLEGHKDLYKDVMMEVPQPLTSPGTGAKGSRGKSVKAFLLITRFFKDVTRGLPKRKSLPHGMAHLDLDYESTGLHFNQSAFLAEFHNAAAFAESLKVSAPLDSRA
ncbi:oocyte zinc finger protein XlCOF29-like [Anomaloglossus baeobatrachus]|uniref:oocyte zinc finger protein XlCOF29-like n=1 Tax=Anomaloglossus baeobatrachus TaxID=238106 RepID=UPI003F506AFD